jgi:hypothetical protein
MGHPLPEVERRSVMRRVVLCAVLTVLIAIPATASPTRRARVATRFIVSMQKPNGSFATGLSPVGTAADAVMSLVAARRGRDAIRLAAGYLERQVDKGNVGDIGLASKVVMAAVAVGANPKRFGGENLVKDIRSTQQPDGRFGESTPVFHHALAMLALAAAGTPPSPPAADWLASAQCDDGGWQFTEPATEADDEHCFNADMGSDFFTSDTNTTSLAVQALAVAPGTLEPGVDPFTYFELARDPIKGGWGYSHELTLTDANSTALVLQAHTAAGADVPEGAAKALAGLQYRRCGKRPGAFAFTWLDENEDGVYGKRSGPDLAATVGAIPGLLRLAFPIGHADVTKNRVRVPSCR